MYANWLETLQSLSVPLKELRSGAPDVMKGPTGETNDLRLAGRGDVFQNPHRAAINGPSPYTTPLYARPHGAAVLAHEAHVAIKRAVQLFRLDTYAAQLACGGIIGNEVNRLATALANRAEQSTLLLRPLKVLPVAAQQADALQPVEQRRQRFLLRAIEFEHIGQIARRQPFLRLPQFGQHGIEVEHRGRFIDLFFVFRFVAH